MQTEQHPLQPFLPANARLLMLGSFPPQRKRWSIDFYYPNWNNDMWRIMGCLFYADKDYFCDNTRKAFRKECLVSFLTRQGIAIYDAATEVRRLQDNASDKFLEVVTPTSIQFLLQQLPACQAIATTGEKATETICEQLAIQPPKVGQSVPFTLCGKNYRLYRMPSSSRAYPLALEKKTAVSRTLFQELGYHI